MFQVGGNVVRRSVAQPVAKRAAGTYTGAAWGASAARALAVLAAGTTAVGTIALADDEVLRKLKLLYSSNFFAVVKYLFFHQSCDM